MIVFFQEKKIVNYSKEITIELIEQHLEVESPYFDPSKPFQMADFRCSTGPNTFLAMQKFLKEVQQKYSHMKGTLTYTMLAISKEYNVSLNERI